jgi:1-deoxy-D-xylulose-5-phosphate reductoisomerase
MKKIAILGITGSIGLSAVEVVRNHSDSFRIIYASSLNNYEQLLSLAAEFAIPEITVVNPSLKKVITDIPAQCQITFGEDKMLEKLADLDIDIVLNAISGSAGLCSTFAVLKRGLKLALANKESLVMAGHLIKKNNVSSEIIPVDSEHSAIFQAIGSHHNNEIDNLILTASGGPFRNLARQDFADITVQDSLNHPIWSMGKKISIDSATMVNKALEVIEAHWLFELPFDQIKVVIHPQSIIHSLVEFIDGSIIAQLSNPNMQLPILYALSYPHRLKSNLNPTNLLQLPPLTFQSVDQDRYPLFHFACKIGREQGILPTVLNAANEAAINLFLNNKIKFTAISPLVQAVVENTCNIADPDLATILETNTAVYEKTLANYHELLN